MITNKSKQRSPIKAVKKTSKSPASKVAKPKKQQKNSLKNSLKKPMKNPTKKQVRRSPLMRTALQPTILGTAKVKKPLAKSHVTFKKKSHRQKPIDALQSLGLSRKTKLIDASLQKKNSPGTPVLFLLKDAKTQEKGGKKMKKTPMAGRRKQYLDHRWLRPQIETRATEGVDFFYNLGMRRQQPAKQDQKVGLRGGVAGLEGRLAGGGGGSRLPGSVRNTNNPTGLSSIVGGVVAAKDVVVPLTSRLPIIDFISTNEFQNMYANSIRKPQSRKFGDRRVASN
ncbi:uncharacterized protein [Drosophila takahashii]|uniref:uncharacterized protein n=1 Tax=Drosophila takahashii TaxID=29030 RepID=UPI003899677F